MWLGVLFVQNGLEKKKWGYCVASQGHVSVICDMTSRGKEISVHQMCCVQGSTIHKELMTASTDGYKLSLINYKHHS